MKKTTKKKSAALALLLSVAMVFTMVPSIAWAADAQKTADIHKYYKETEFLGDGSYLITVEDEGTLYALKAPEGGTTGTKVEDSEALTLQDDFAVDPDDSLLWNYTVNGEGSTPAQALFNQDGCLFFTSNSAPDYEGLKYQTNGYRAVNRDEAGHLYVVSEKTGNPKHYMAFNATSKKFSTTSDEAEAVVVKLFRPSYAVDFDLAGHGGQTPERAYTSYDPATGDTITMPADPTDPDYIFLGWLDESGNPWTVTDPITANMVLTADWQYNEPAVNKAKEDARATLLKAKDPSVLNKYEIEQQEAILSLIISYTTVVDNSTLIEQVDQALANFNKELNALPTSAVVKDLGKVAVKAKSAKAGKKKVTVKWSPKKSKFDGYEVKYRIKGKKSWKSVTVNSPSASKKVIKKLKKGKKYQVKVRGFKMYGYYKNIKVYGKYSKTKTTKKVK